MGLLDIFKRTTPVQTLTSVDDLQASSGPIWNPSVFDGEKFFGGLGVKPLSTVDYWTLRQRSAQFFNDNLYARGLVRRLVTNEINTGMMPEVHPEERLLGLAEGTLADWSDDVESRWAMWVRNERLCDWYGQRSLGALQRVARLEALVSGDVLVLLRYDRRGRPRVQLVSGGRVRTPPTPGSALKDTHYIIHGVEHDASRRVVAYWVQIDTLEYERIPAYGSRTGRRLAWLKFGTDKRFDDVRGQPLIAPVMQSLKELDRYRDAAGRKAVLNSLFAMFIKKGENKLGSLPGQNGASRNTTVDTADSDGTPRRFNVSEYGAPGMFIDELNWGEEPKAFGADGTDLNFPQFEEAILQAVGWTSEIPPEILKLAFSNNYSASQAAINEFKIYLNMRWAVEAEDWCCPIYDAWFTTEVILRRINAPGFLRARNDPDRYAEAGAWTSAEWLGSIKPSTDMFKAMKGSELLISMGLSTRAREARIHTGTKFSRNIKALRQENQQLAEVNEVLAAMERPEPPPEEDEEDE